MSDLLQRLGSRKFLLALGATIGFILLGITGQMDMQQAVENAKMIVLGYLAAEGVPDAVTRYQEGQVKVEEEITKQVEASNEEDVK